MTGSRSFIGIFSEADIDKARHRDEGTPMRDALKVADLDANGDNRLSRAEVPDDHALRFEWKLVDRNRDGYVTDDELAKLGRKRHVVLAVPQFNGLGTLLAETDIVASVPDYTAAALTAAGGLRAEDLLPSRQTQRRRCSGQARA